MADDLHSSGGGKIPTETAMVMVIGSSVAVFASMINFITFLGKQEVVRRYPATIILRIAISELIYCICYLIFGVILLRHPNESILEINSYVCELEIIPLIAYNTAAIYEISYAYNILSYLLGISKPSLGIMHSFDLAVFLVNIVTIGAYSANTTFIVNDVGFCSLPFINRTFLGVLFLPPILTYGFMAISFILALFHRKKKFIFGIELDELEVKRFIIYSFFYLLSNTMVTWNKIALYTNKMSLVPTTSEYSIFTYLTELLSPVILCGIRLADPRVKENFSFTHFHHHDHDAPLHVINDDYYYQESQEDTEVFYSARESAVSDIVGTPAGYSESFYSVYNESRPSGVSITQSPLKKNRGFLTYRK